jgi:hypothetical protein
LLVRVKEHFISGIALDGVSRDQGPLAGVKPPHSASEARALDRLDPVHLRWPWT